jgi:aminoglycoside phosphotransferase (APT) family kinase protein
LSSFEAIELRLPEYPTSPIHGEYFGKNILAREGTRGWDVFGIDWETAAVGPSFLDIASLSSGDWSMEERRIMRSAYFAEYTERTASRLTWSEFETMIRDLSLYQALRWIGWWPGAGVKQFDRWIRELDLVMREVGSDGRLRQ